MNNSASNIASKGIMFLMLTIPDNLSAADPTLVAPVDFSSFVKMFLGLIAVLMLIFFVAWLSRKMKLLQHISTGYQIKHLASLSLSNREKVSLIEVAGKQILIGVSPGMVNKLHVFEETIEEVTTEKSESDQQLFSGYFKKALGLSTTKEKQQ